VLRHLPKFSDPQILVGTDTLDDAGVYRVRDDLAIVQTADYFAPVVDDAYSFGAIAAANAISDAYAMGARPVTALNLVGFPRSEVPLEVLFEILRGGAEKCAEAGVSIIGGHSIDDHEPKYGLAVMALVHPDRMVTNAGARPGDRLVLTKPLGMGIITTGIRGQKVSAEVIAEATAIMSTLNRAACEAMLQVEVHAATDVTGYGLLGHLHEMLAASGMAAAVSVAQVPVLPAAWELAAQGVKSGGAGRTERFLADQVTWAEGVTRDAQIVLLDAETSGGLLVAVPAERETALLEALAQRSVATRAVVGEIREGPPGRVEVTA